MLATKDWVLWSTDGRHPRGPNLRICGRDTWNDYAREHVSKGKPTPYRFVMESDDEDELERMRNLTREY